MACISVLLTRRNYRAEKAFFLMRLVTFTRALGKTDFSMATEHLKTTAVFMRVFGKTEVK